jgi:hypothetical protein
VRNKLESGQKAHLLDLRTISDRRILRLLELASVGRQDGGLPAALKIAPRDCVCGFLCSFEQAVTSLGGQFLAITPRHTENVEDIVDFAVKSLRELAADNEIAIVLRHNAASGIAHTATRTEAVTRYRVAVINSGDDGNENPVDGLIILSLIKSVLGRFDCAILAVGDSTTAIARSTLLALHRLGASIVLWSPASLIPLHIARLPHLRILDPLAALPKADLVLSLPFTDAAEPNIRYFDRLMADKIRSMSPTPAVIHLTPFAPEPVNGTCELLKLTPTLVPSVAVHTATRAAVLVDCLSTI